MMGRDAKTRLIGVHLARRVSRQAMALGPSEAPWHIWGAVWRRGGVGSRRFRGGRNTSTAGPTTLPRRNPEMILTCLPFTYADLIAAVICTQLAVGPHSRDVVVTGHM